MQLKNIFVSALALLGIHGQMEAAPSTGGEGKDLFREMVYSAKQTVFNLNAPTAVDAVTGPHRSRLAGRRTSPCASTTGERAARP